jgi:magnesium-transporting ATPase (P-type)
LPSNAVRLTNAPNEDDDEGDVFSISASAAYVLWLLVMHLLFLSLARSLVRSSSATGVCSTSFLLLLLLLLFLFLLLLFISSVVEEIFCLTTIEQKRREEKKKNSLVLSDFMLSERT